MCPICSSIPNQEKAAKLLTDNSCADAVFFCNSGAEANEAAIKLARRYHQKVLGNGRYEIITFNQSFHGRTLATLTATGQDKVKEGFVPLPEGFVHVPLQRYRRRWKLRSTTARRRSCWSSCKRKAASLPVDPEFVRDSRASCATSTACCSSSTKSRRAWDARASCSPTSITASSRIFSRWPKVSAAASRSARCWQGQAGRSVQRRAATATTFGGTPIATAAVVSDDRDDADARTAGARRGVGRVLVNELARSKLAGNPFVREIRGIGLARRHRVHRSRSPN